MLSDISIFTAAGESVKFSDLWDQNEGVAVVALMRHFGCFCSWDFAASLRESKERFEAAGVKLIAVGVGSSENAQLFAERLPFPLDSLYADPERKAYDAMGLYFGLRRTFLSPASAKVFSRWGEVKKNMKNYTLKATPDDRSSVLQQGGMLVFKGKQLLYAMKEEGPGDHASLDKIFEICSKVSIA
ncbi:peroxiredoxin-like family protein [Acinetobacter baumannii]